MKPGQVVDVLVIGSGAAGLTFAMEMAKSRQVHVVTKAASTESNTRYAQGGIAAVLRIDDDYQTHVEDTLGAGAGICDREAVKILVHEAPARIRDLMVAGVEFDRAPGSDLLFTREGGHRAWRVLHVGDMTGQAIEDALFRSASGNPSIRTHEGFTAVDLLVDGRICYGAELMNREGRLIRILAKTVFLATGGAGQLFSHTTNPSIATGDGVAMAGRAGAATESMEFIQFHPTALYHPPHPFFLISEAVRGEGAVLRNQARERFMVRYDLRRELAPRDIVSRAIVSEMDREGARHVWLDLTHLRRDFVEQRFPTITARLREIGLEPCEELIPVAPAAHYLCGGVKTDIDGKTDIISLYAGGEVACTGVHGANRLASNSLLESVVFAYRASVNADRYLRYLPDSWQARAQELLAAGPLRELQGSNGPPEEIRSLRHRLQQIMWDGCGIIRTDPGLEGVLSELRQIQQEILDLRSAYRLEPALVELGNLVEVALLVVQAARGRRANVGTHFNRDLDQKG